MIVNARMYSVTPAAAEGWKRLLPEAVRRAGLTAEIVDYPAPARLEGLWARSDLLAVFMCGWPFAQRRFSVRPVAAPVTEEAAREGIPGHYRTLFMVPTSSTARCLEETFSGRLAYTNPESHSGYNAVRYHLSAYINETRKTLYRTLVGPLITPRRVVEALAAGEADVGPLDSYAWSLLCRYEPELTRHVRILTRSVPAPMPLLVASDTVNPQAITALQTALLTLNTERDATLLRPLGLRGFITPSADAWQVVCDREEIAFSRGYATLR
ncbi:TPA: PhnD/SsuA/transferrin family substrate-binding protein [Citrobacter koseri]|nr:PhnD/SsuA/transferrin family substrate-binding protein [Citrobacter koseri]